MKIRSFVVGFSTMLTLALTAGAGQQSVTGYASWYGEDHRGRLMANGKKFNPDKLTAASWFYPLGTKVRVTAIDENTSRHGTKSPARTVLVTITDRGPSRDLVREGRIIDLGHAAFKQLAHPDLGLIQVQVETLN
jgi:rare lipoprotein A